MRGLVGVVAIVFMAGPASGYCSQPDPPYCATTYGSFDSSYDFDSCKSQMQSYQSDVESFLSCQKRDSQTAIDEYNDAVESFNRRAREGIR